MKIYLFLAERIISFSLPTEVVGSFSFDENPNEESKLINIEARDSDWILYSTVDVNVIENNSIVGVVTLKEDSFHVIRRGDKNYLIYVSDLSLNKISAYSYDNTIDLIIGGNNNANVQYPCPFLNNLEVRIHYVDNKLILEKNNNGGVYINNKVVLSNQYYINIGEQVNIYGLKVMFLNGILLMNNPGGKLIILPSSKISNYVISDDNSDVNVEVKDRSLYEKNDYFSKSPRIRRIIEKKTIKLSPSPKLEGNQELPMILTVGPMFTMGITSGVMVLNVINKINTGETTFKDSWTSLVPSIAMLVSMILWPLLTRVYNKKIKEKRREEIVYKYGEYLNQKQQELFQEAKLQKDILIENLIDVKECLNVINSRNMYFWNKRVDESDFLVVRVGIGNDLLNAEIEYPEEGFTIEEDELKVQADKLVEEFKYWC